MGLQAVTQGPADLGRLNTEPVCPSAKRIAEAVRPKPLPTRFALCLQLNPFRLVNQVLLAVMAIQLPRITVSTNWPLQLAIVHSLGNAKDDHFPVR